MDAKFFGSFLAQCPVCKDRRMCRDLDTDERWLYRNCLYCGAIFATEREPETRILSETEIAQRFPQFTDPVMRKSPPKTPRRRR